MQTGRGWLGGNEVMREIPFEFITSLAGCQDINPTRNSQTPRMKDRFPYTMLPPPRAVCCPSSCFHGGPGEMQDPWGAGFANQACLCLLPHTFASCSELLFSKGFVDPPSYASNWISEKPQVVQVGDSLFPFLLHKSGSKSMPSSQSLLSNCTPSTEYLHFGSLSLPGTHYPTPRLISLLPPQISKG